MQAQAGNADTSANRGLLPMPLKTCLDAPVSATQELLICSFASGKTVTLTTSFGQPVAQPVTLDLQVIKDGQVLAFSKTWNPPDTTTTSEPDPPAVRPTADEADQPHNFMRPVRHRPLSPDGTDDQDDTISSSGACSEQGDAASGKIRLVCTMPSGTILVLTTTFAPGSEAVTLNFWGIDGSIPLGIAETWKPGSLPGNPRGPHNFMRPIRRDYQILIWVPGMPLEYLVK